MAASTKIDAEVVTITPDMAQRIIDETEKQIESNKVRHRNVSKRAVAKYARDMRAGNWSVTHQGIAFDEDEWLMDGRHRLHAVVAAGVPVRMMVVRGLPKKVNRLVNTADLMDGGVKRGVAQQLHIQHGIPNSSYYASSCRAIANTLMKDGHITMSVSQTLEIKNVYEPAFERVLGHVGAIRLQAFVMGPLVMYVHAFPKKGNDFADGYCSLENLHKGDPRLTLHRHFSTTVVRRGEHGYITKLKATSSCLQAFHEDRDIDYVHGSVAALDWLVDAQKPEAKELIKLF